jgi:FAD/FMN-containing dehydrogenase
MTVLTSVRIAGVVATGCHGATINSRTIPDQVVSLQIVTGDGELHEFSDVINREEMEAARVSLGKSIYETLQLIRKH